MSRKINLTNRKFGRLTVVEDTGKRHNKYVIWKCICDCGNIIEVQSSYLLHNGRKSCGCLMSESKTIHGHTNGQRYRSRTYRSWDAMKQRCLNINNFKFNYYGGRGIMVCERWMVFENFLADMGERPEGLTLDRIDNDGHYEPINCKWSTYKQQNNNRRVKC